MMVWVVEGGRGRVEWGRGIGLRGKGVEGGDQDLRGGGIMQNYAHSIAKSTFRAILSE